VGWVLVGSRPDCYATGVAQQELFEDHPVTYLRSTADPDAGFAALQRNVPRCRFRSPVDVFIDLALLATLRYLQVQERPLVAGAAA
jgi:hypothetical protein